MLLQFEECSTSNFELEVMLRERDQMLKQIHYHLDQAQQLMKNKADKKRIDLKFKEGSLVFLKLRPFRQQSGTKRLFQNLATKYYGPFKVLARVGKAAYKLQLSAEYKIHSVFHVSLLKPMLGKHRAINLLPRSLSAGDEFVIMPEDIVATRYDAKGYLEGLMHWKGLPTLDAY